MRHNLFFLLLLSLILSSCAALNDQRQVTLPVQPAWQESQKWWKAFNDPLMNDFAENVLNQSLDLKMAEARLLAARAVKDSQHAMFFPDLSVSSHASRGNTNAPTSQTFSQNGFDASWEIDVFGRIRAKISTAEADILASEAGIADIKNSVVAELVRTIIEWRQAKQTVKEIHDLLKSQDDEVKLLASRASAGLIDASFYERAKAQRAQTATSLPQAKAAANAAQYKIVRLMDEDADTVEQKLGNAAPLLLVVPSPKRIGEIDVTTLKSRPDIAIAAAELEKANAQVREAEANFWPRLSLTAFFGIQEGTSGLRLADNPIWSLAGNIATPLLNFGRLEGALDAADARSTESMLRYKSTVNLAVEETRTALSDYLYTVNAVNGQQEALKHRQDTVHIARMRFSKGLTDMTDLTTAQSELDQATLALINLKTSAAIAYVRLHKALGVAVLVDPAQTQ